MIDLKIIQSQLGCSFVIIMNNYAFLCFFIRRTVDSPHKRPDMQKMFPFDDVKTIKSVTNANMKINPRYVE